ncbi:MAG: hypothetical protein IJT96_02525 [Lachnospiraceae bacterium]|nr:hypothetical protein [Lachnospiraceae bacterium]
MKEHGLYIIKKDFFELVRSLGEISSCYPIISEYIDHEYTMNGVHVILRRVDATQEIQRRLKRVLAFEMRRPNYFPQHITDIKNKMIEELRDRGN